MVRFVALSNGIKSSAKVPGKHLMGIRQHSNILAYNWTLITFSTAVAWLPQGGM